MIVIGYHGTEKIFKKFDGSFIGTATGVKSGYFFFTSSIENASTFGDVILKCELKFNNPYIVTGGLQGKSPRMWADDVMLGNFENDTEYDGVILKGVVDSMAFIESDIYVPFEFDDIIFKVLRA